MLQILQQAPNILSWGSSGCACCALIESFASLFRMSSASTLRLSCDVPGNFSRIATGSVVRWRCNARRLLVAHFLIQHVLLGLLLPRLVTNRVLLRSLARRFALRVLGERTSPGCACFRESPIESTKLVLALCKEIFYFSFLLDRVWRCVTLLSPTAVNFSRHALC